ncbi:MAG: glucosaminidase domain-containing protein [Bacteroidales bacterium]|jgi:LysM repeat protein|nr:glucosaminidase domain-containing protein [Bacteroidales bacterium]
MYKIRTISFLIIVLILLDSCRSSRPVVNSSSEEPNAAAYIAKYKDLAVSEMKRTGIPASITLAQGMIESDFGRSRLAREANNHFGIKCHDNWTGPTIRHNDDRRNECFRKYSRAQDSFYDHSDFLKSTSRYSFLFDLPSTDYKGWAKGLKKAGYATNPDYADMLIRKIEVNNLYYYDRGFKAPEKPVAETVPPKPGTVRPVPGEPVTPVNINNGTSVVQARVPRIMENNRIQYIIVKEGETIGSIEKDFELLKWELTRYNELDNDFTPVAGQILYLQPKRDKAEPGREVHIVVEGETLYYISQKYGVKLKKLYEYNMIPEGEDPVAGQKIWLRAMKPAN